MKVVFYIEQIIKSISNVLYTYTVAIIKIRHASSPLHTNVLLSTRICYNAMYNILALNYINRKEHSRYRINVLNWIVVFDYAL